MACSAELLNSFVTPPRTVIMCDDPLVLWTNNSLYIPWGFFWISKWTWSYQKYSFNAKIPNLTNFLLDILHLQDNCCLTLVPAGWMFWTSLWPATYIQHISFPLVNHILLCSFYRWKRKKKACKSVPMYLVSAYFVFFSEDEDQKMIILLNSLSCVYLCTFYLTSSPF